MAMLRKRRKTDDSRIYGFYRRVETEIFRRFVEKKYYLKQKIFKSSKEIRSTISAVEHASRKKSKKE